MNRLEIHRDNGFPVQRQTFEFMQEAYRTAIGHLCRVHGSGNIVLYGLEDIDGNDQWTDGAVFINGDLLFVRGGVAHDPFIVIDETVESVRYQSGEVLSAYRTRIGRIVNGAQQGGIRYFNFRRANTPPPPTVSAWTNVLTSSTGNIHIFSSIQARVLNDNGRRRVELRGEIGFQVDERDIMAGQRITFTMPAGFRPRFNRVVAAGGVPLIIQPSGECVLRINHSELGFAASNRRHPVVCEYEL